MTRLTVLLAVCLCALPHVISGKDISSTRAMSGEIRYGGQRYYPLTTIAHYSDGSSAYSCVLLIPWDKRPEASVSIDNDGSADYGISTVTLGKNNFRVGGRYLAISDGTGSYLRLLPGELSIDDYKDSDRLEVAIISLLRKADGLSQ